MRSVEFLGAPRQWVDSRLRGRIRLIRSRRSMPTPGYQITFEVTIEGEGFAKPTCIAENVHRGYG
jgi:hypothetical protein